MKIWIVTRANERGEGPNPPVPYATEAAAEAHMEALMAYEWHKNGPEHNDTGERMPYPDDWRVAQETILKRFTDGSWKPYTITCHEVDFQPVAGPGDLLAALSSAEAELADVYKLHHDETEGRTNG